jgi:hypothetical protein
VPDAHGNPGRLSVQRVFQQFLDHRARTLDHFTGRDLVGELFRQNPDDSHARSFEQAVEKAVAQIDTFC